MDEEAAVLGELRVERHGQQTLLAIGLFPQRDFAGQIEERLGIEGFAPQDADLSLLLDEEQTSDRLARRRRQAKGVGGVIGDTLEFDLAGQPGGRGGWQRRRWNCLGPFHLGTVPGHVQTGRVVLDACNPLAVSGGVEVRATQGAHPEVRVGPVAGAQRFDGLAVWADPEERPGGDVETPLCIEGDAVGIRPAGDIGERLSLLLLARRQRQPGHLGLGIGEDVETSVGAEGDAVEIFQRRGGHSALGPVGSDPVDVGALLIGVVDGAVGPQRDPVDGRLDVGQLHHQRPLGQQDRQQLLAIPGAGVEYPPLGIDGDPQRLAAEVHPPQIGSGIGRHVPSQEPGGRGAERLSEIDGAIGPDHQTFGRLDGLEVRTQLAFTAARRRRGVQARRRLRIELGLGRRRLLGRPGGLTRCRSGRLRERRQSVEQQREAGQAE